MQVKSCALWPRQLLAGLTEWQKECCAFTSQPLWSMPSSKWASPIPEGSGSAASIVSWHSPQPLLCHLNLRFKALICFCGFGWGGQWGAVSSVPSFLEFVLLNPLRESHVEISFLSSTLSVSSGSTAGLQQALPGCCWTGRVPEPRWERAALVLSC